MTDPAPIPQPPAPPAVYAAGPSVEEDPGFVLGVVALVCAFFVQIVGLVLGIVALQQSRRAGRQNPTAIAAIIVSAGSIVLTVLVFVAVAAVFVLVFAMIAILGAGTGAWQFS